MVDWEKEAKYWKEKYERQYNSWLSLRTCWNKLIREVDDHEIRMIMAKNWTANKNKELSK
jgi:hypothetical protein